jgi:hypothetical protein
MPVSLCVVVGAREEKGRWEGKKMMLKVESGFG